MGCLKLHTEKEYTALKVVYRKNEVEKDNGVGGDFWSGFASGAVSSLISTGMQAAVTKGGVITDFGNSVGYKALVIASGGLSGGISSVIAGGNFWGKSY